MKNTISLILVCLVSTNLMSQQIRPDSMFGSNGTGFEMLPGVHSELAIKPDKSFLVGNTNYYGNDKVTMGITAMKPDGTIDSTFGINGWRDYSPIDYNYCTFRNLEVLQDGKIVIGGLVDIPPTEDTYYLFYRLLPDGTPDSSFNEMGYMLFGPANIGEFIPLSVDADAAGRLYFFGTINFNIAMMRMLENGEPDYSFGTNGLQTISLYPDGNWDNRGGEIHIMPDGRLLTTSAAFNSGLRGNIVAMFHPDGSLDSTYAENGIRFIQPSSEYGPLLGIHPQPDGTVIFKDYLSYTSTANLFKLNANGDIVKSFGDNGFVKIDTIANSSTRQTLIIAPDGSLLMITGLYLEGHYVGRISRHDQDFNMDPDFGEDGFVTIQNADQELLIYGGLFQDDQHLILNALTGTSLFYHNRIYRFTWEDQINSIINQDDETGLVIYPNPAQSCFSIKSMTDAGNHIHIHLVNVQGQIMQSWNGGDGPAYIIRNHVAPGLYYLHIIDQQKAVTLPIQVAASDLNTTR